MRVYEAVHIMSRALKGVRKEQSQIHGTAAGSFLLKKRKCPEGGGGYLVRNGVCVSIKQLAKAVERAEAALDLESLVCRVLAWLCKWDLLASFAKCVREWMCVDGLRVIDGNVRMVFVKSSFIPEGCLSSLHDYDRALNIVRASTVEGFAKHERRVYADLESGARRKLLKGFLLLKEKGNGSK